MPTYLDDPQEYALRAAGLVNTAGVPRTAENYNRASQYIAQGQVGAGPVFEQAMDRMLARPTSSQVRKAQPLPLPLPPPEAPESQGGQTPLPPVAAGTSATPATPEAVIDDVLNADVHRTPQTGRHTPTTPPVLLGEGMGANEAGLGLAALLSILRGKPRVPGSLGVTLNPRGGGSGPTAGGGGGALPGGGGGGGGGGGPLPGPVPALPSGGGQAVPMPSPYNRGMAVENDPTVVVSPTLKPAPNLNPDPNVKRYPPVPGSAGDGTVNSDLFLDGYAVNKPTKPKLEDEVKRRMRLNKQRDQRRSRRSSNDSEE